jgi:hypothetical protein
MSWCPVIQNQQKPCVETTTVTEEWVNVPVRRRAVHHRPVVRDKRVRKAGLHRQLSAAVSSSQQSWDLGRLANFRQDGRPRDPSFCWMTTWAVFHVEC